MNLNQKNIDFLFNIWLKLRKITNRIKYGDVNFPNAIYIETHSVCNRACSYCACSLKTDSKKTMSEDTYTRTIDRLVEMKWSGILGFHYLNEPLLDTRLPRLISIAHERLPRAKLKLETNGDALTIGVASILVDSGIMRVRISRHEPFSNARDERIAFIIKRWPKIFHEYQLGKDAPILAFNNKLGISAPKTDICVAPTGQLPIRLDGSITLCCCDYEREINYGNIHDKSIMEIWNSPEFIQDRKSLASGGRPRRICIGCSGQGIVK